MKIRMLQSIKGATDPSGIRSMTYEKGKKYDVYDELAQVFLREGWAKKEKEKDVKGPEEKKDLEGSEENKEEAPAETKVEDPEEKKDKEKK